MADAARSTVSFGAGYDPPNAGSPTEYDTLNPYSRAACAMPVVPARCTSWMNALLHDSANALRKSVVPRPSPWKLWNVRPSTTSVGGHVIGVDGDAPAPSTAVDVMILNVLPGA